MVCLSTLPRRADARSLAIQSEAGVFPEFPKMSHSKKIVTTVRAS
jgi:hypothetical protein